MSGGCEDRNPENPTGGDLAVIGEGSPNESRVSIQTLQGIYHELTGKTEDVSKSYNQHFQISLEDLQQLNHRIIQCYEQYHIKAENCSVKVFFLNDTQERFSSFERFSAFNAGTTSTVESVLINYNFLIILPKSEKPQSYTVSVRIASRMAVEKQMRENMPFHLPKILRLMGNRTATVNIKYIDYAVARSLMTAVDQWFEGLPEAHSSWLQKQITRKSHLLPVIAKYLAGIGVAYLIFLHSAEFVPADASLHQLAVFSLLSFCGLFASYRAAYHLGSSAENHVDSWTPLSYLSLTAGDRNLIQKSSRSNKRSAFFACLNFAVAVSVSLIANLIVLAIVPK